MPSRKGWRRCTLRKPAQFFVTALMPMSIGFAYVEPKGISIRRRRSRHAPRTSCLFMPLKPKSKRMVMWNPSESPVVGSTRSCRGSYVKLRWLPGTASGLSLEKSCCGARGYARRRVLNSMTSRMGVPNLVNSSFMRCSWMITLLLWEAMAS